MPGNSLVRLFRTGAVTPSALEQVNQAPLAQGGGRSLRERLCPEGRRRKAAEKDQEGQGN